MPFGTIYSSVPVAAGVGIAVGGCMLDVRSKGHGALCEVSIRGGLVLTGTAPRVFTWALAPDLRHWERLLIAFHATASPTHDLEQYASGEPTLILLEQRTEQERALPHE